MGRANAALAAASVVLAAVGVVLGGPTLADSPSPTPTWLDEVTFNGFFETSYSYNFNRPISGTNQYRVFDVDDNTFKLDVFELVAQKAVSKPRESGFRVDVALGGSVPRVAASAGLFRDAAGVAEDVDLQQAFVSYIAPAGSGLRFDAGKFVTAHGYEVIPGYDGWNDNATRSLLFGYAIPFTHTGIRATYAFSPRVTAQLSVVNGWDVARDNNRSKSLGAQFTLVPTSTLTLLVGGMSGPERANNDSDLRSLLDVVAILKPTPRVTLAVNGDAGAEENAVAPGSTARWTAIAGYARFAFTSAFAVSARAEFFDDPDGARTGISQSLTTITVTPELRLTPHLLTRGDLRMDASDAAVFDRRGTLDTGQPTLLVEALYSF